MVRGRGRQETLEGPSPIDVHVGLRVRLRRTLLGMTQEQLGRAVGLTFQQIQKYERGANRISASRLYDFSGVLKVPISYFFENVDSSVVDDVTRDLSHTGGMVLDGTQRDPALRRETLELVRAYCRIENENTRRKIKELMTLIGSDSAEGNRG